MVETRLVYSDWFGKETAPYAFLWMIWMKELNYTFKLSYNIKLGLVTELLMFQKAGLKLKIISKNKTIKN